MKKLINPRGRVIEVDEKDVPSLLKRGFLHVPSDEDSMIYSQVHDKGPGYEEPYIPQDTSFKRELPKLLDILEAEIV